MAHFTASTPRKVGASAISPDKRGNLPVSSQISPEPEGDGYRGRVHKEEADALEGTGSKNSIV